MIETYLLLTAGVVYLLGSLSLFLGPPLRKWIWAGGSLLFLLLLTGIVLLTQFSLFSQAVDVRLINYSSRSGVLYFLQEESQAGNRIRYEKAVKANEGSQLKVAEEEGGFDTILFLSKGEIFTVPVQQKDEQLEVWENELKPVGGRYRTLLQDWQQRQQIYSLAIGLMLFWFLLHLIYLYMEKKKSRTTGPARRPDLSARE